jgi:hypothetical protein
LQLRAYLAQQLKAIRTPGPTEPTWIGTLAAHPHLFTDQVCRELAAQALTGDASAFEAMCRDLELGDKSWVVREFVLAQIDAGCTQLDGAFRSMLPQLKALLQQHELLIDDGLARLLTRYHGCTSTEVHAGLRDLAVARWKNPLLKTNDKRWGKVSDDVRQMVKGWLQLKWMVDFFHLLSEGGSNDQRRLDFWLRYRELVDDMYFALGSEAAENSHPDFRQMHDEMQGRLLRLSSGSRTNNAFLINIGDYWVVEFGEHGNACFVFDKRKTLPFPLTKYVAPDSTELKHVSRVLRFVHVDSRDQTWEEKFAAELAPYLGAPASNDRRRTRAPVGAARAHAAPARVLAPAPDPAPVTRIMPAFTQAGFDALAEEHGLRIVDMRSIGGALWAHIEESENVVTRQLKSWGFRYNDKRAGWWRR